MLSVPCSVRMPLGSLVGSPSVSPRSLWRPQCPSRSERAAPDGARLRPRRAGAAQPRGAGGSRAPARPRAGVVAAAPVLRVGGAPGSRARARGRRIAVERRDGREPRGARAATSTTPTASSRAASPSRRSSTPSCSRRSSRVRRACGRASPTGTACVARSTSPARQREHRHLPPRHDLADAGRSEGRARGRLAARRGAVAAGELRFQGTGGLVLLQELIAPRRRTTSSSSRS